MIKRIHHLFVWGLFLVNNFTKIYPTSFTELSGCNRDHMTHKPQLFTIHPSLYKKGLPAPIWIIKLFFYTNSGFTEIKNSFVSYLGSLIFWLLKSH